jgi:osmoprotectant transport system permease protein
LSFSAPLRFSEKLPLLCAISFALFALAAPVRAQSITLGSKSFNESAILAECLAELAREAGATVAHKARMGGTGVLWAALKSGEIDAYVEYTGTLLRETFALDNPRDLDALAKLMARDGVRMGPALGFNNTYAIGMKREAAARLGIRTISDLAKHPELKLGFGNEFTQRADGWPGLRDTYGLPHTDVTGLEHSLAYEAMQAGRIDVTDLYSTDAEIEQFDLVALDDDRSFFPAYDAVIVYRTDLATRAPAVVKQFERLEGRIDEALMISMNAAVKIEKRTEVETARRFVHEILPKLERGNAVDAGAVRSEGRRALADRIADVMGRMPVRTAEHLGLVFVSLCAGVLLALPLGVLAHRKPRLGQGVLGVAGVLQTIPSIALLVLLIPLVGIGWWPAVIALFLYSLLPILRNTHAGLASIDPALVESANALGLPPRARLRLIELPLASRAILAGVKTAAVINVGTATLGGFIGAGGYGQTIFAGISRQDNVQILAGAIPAALLAVLMQAAFEIADRVLIPRGLRPADT